MIVRFLRIYSFSFIPLLVQNLLCSFRNRGSIKTSKPALTIFPVIKRTNMTRHSIILLVAIAVAITLFVPTSVQAETQVADKNAVAGVVGLGQMGECVIVQC